MKLSRINGQKRSLVINNENRYSSLAIALVLPESSRLVACERHAKSLDVAKKYYQLAGVSHKVDVKLGLAMDSLESLILNGERGRNSSTFRRLKLLLLLEYIQVDLNYAWMNVTTKEDGENK
ncbi:catechol O-methyltransferase domain-containing protein 1-like [Glycine max]|uniref:catechol O-methyltransferase domain-containing protein 1-like n=1 Tax=Glycine max TaxID=3847 RepID=UPI0007193CB1|nr:catechol O-methyltransferase domain-containing protein 1-like [Glycine max]|eukprot:XP_014623259.1 catechol O-methyltransferase domain-containing protein 1-like [Glycine max]